jgi:hypothetical protein
MNIILHVEPKTPPLTWEQFLEVAPVNSIALDGYVIGSTRFFRNEKGVWANFNHHEEVDRLSTRATCAQALLAIRQGLMKSFSESNEVHLYVNDCDQDVCLSVFLIKNYFLVENVINPLINKLVHIEDMMDTCAGAYPFPIELPALREVAWVFHPYTLLRMNGGVDRKSENEFKSVIENVENRILKYITGHSEKIEPDSSYEIIGGGKDWKMVIEKGYEARTQMMKDGICAFVSVRTIDKSKSRYVYSIGKMSTFIPFDIPKILTWLNNCDQVTETDRWGGSDTIAGSPRVGGSALDPKGIEYFINLALYGKNDD